MYDSPAVTFKTKEITFVLSRDSREKSEDGAKIKKWLIYHMRQKTANYHKRQRKLLRKINESSCVN